MRSRLSGSSPRRRQSSRRRRCSGSFWTRGRPATTLAYSSGHQEGRSGARDGPGQAGQHHAAHQVQAEAYILSKEEGGRHTPVLQRVPSQVLLPDDGRDGSCELAEGVEMVMPADQYELQCGAITRSHDKELRFAISRGWQGPWARASSRVIGNKNEDEGRGTRDEKTFVVRVSEATIVHRLSYFKKSEAIDNARNSYCLLVVSASEKTIQRPRIKGTLPTTELDKYCRVRRNTRAQGNKSVT